MIYDTHTTGRSEERDVIRRELIAQLESVLFKLYPAGSVLRNKFHIGDVQGNSGNSLEMVLSGERAGFWIDRATGDGGDIFNLIAAGHGMDVCADFPKVLQQSRDLLGQARSTPQPKDQFVPKTEDRGKPTGEWHYLDSAGKLLAKVYRYDPPGRKKEFRPWDAKLGKWSAPNPRPLYNQPGIAASDMVILVEGEKCAQALIDIGQCATTAMQGASAPVEKTDWSPLAGKQVLIWPDQDKPGWEYANRAAQSILQAGAVSCFILNPPCDKPEKWDAADALQEGWDIRGFLATGDRIPVRPLLEETILEDLPASANWETEDGMALIFTHQHYLDWRYCALWGKWMVWTGMRWNVDHKLYVLHLVRIICRLASCKAKENSRQKTRLASASSISAVEKIARSDPKHASSAEEWDVDPWLLNTPGGVVDLKTGQVRPHRREDWMTKVTTATPAGDCPQWKRFLEDVTGGDRELQNYLQRIAGYCLTGLTCEHALFFLYGTGANGKSVFLNVLSIIMGEYAVNAPVDTFMEARGDRHPTDLAGLRGARMVSATETEQGRRWNESKVKNITGGDKVSARFMRQDFFEYTPQFKLVIAGNHKPALRNVDEAMKRRLHLIPFIVTIPPERRDGRLQEKLLTERDGILAWAVEGCKAWQQQGLKPPACVVSATEEYFDEEDAIGDFLKEETQRSVHARVPISTVFGRWQAWAEPRGEYVGNSRWLVQQLVNRGFTRLRMQGGVKALAGLHMKQGAYDSRNSDCGNETR
uniref:DNA primase/helicase, phage-associated n=1 Tax=Candidatus Nitrotoga fabula TaxID=2182327 RepID=A0A2X0QVL0_9PROT|nr:DNA primase/helicase, phage-associated [Candidatus Nitrotoga fabula]